MADFIRSAKSSSDWSQNELIAYNITVSHLPPDEFFPTPDPSLDDIDLAILNSPLGGTNPTLSDDAASYLSYLGYAVEASQECFVNRFAVRTLELLGFQEHGVIVTGYYTIPLTICGDDRVARAEVCLMHHRGFVLLVLVQDKEFVDAEPRVVAEVIAVFQLNNKKREECGLSPLDAMTIPCIKIFGTHPIFYLVPVTAELSEAVKGGWYPKHTTQVSRCVTVAPHMDTSIGMENTEYRKLALERLLAFKGLAKSHWVHILEGI